MVTDKLIDDVVVLPVKDHPVHRNVITTKDKVEYVIETSLQNQCVVVVNGEKFSIALSAQQACELIYGGIGE